MTSVDLSSPDSYVLYCSSFSLGNTQTKTYTEQLVPFLNRLLTVLGEAWVAGLQQTLEFLNVQLDFPALHLLTELWLWLYKAHYAVDEERYWTQLMGELQLQDILTPQHPDGAVLQRLVGEFLQAAADCWSDGLVDLEALRFNLPSQQAPVVQPLLLAKEVETRLSEQLYKVLQRVSTPFEALFGTELLDKLTSCTTRLSHGVASRFQVTKDFVTQIVEFRPTSSNLNVRVIQPSRLFYERALEVWVELGDNTTLQPYLTHIKEGLGSAWRESLFKPALHFFRVAKEEWDHCSEGGTDLFLAHIRSRMFASWNASIVETSQGLSTHMQLKQ